ncbi:MAG: GAF domain-containing protein [Anaerolineales bacterium]|nr:GAF domain-containing protein [Anaerolineales bacterium]
MTNANHPETNDRTPKPRSGLAGFWNRITQPHPSIKTVVSRRLAQLTASLALGLIVLLIIGMVSSSLRSGRVATAVFIEIAMIVVFFMIYALARSRRPQIGATLLVWLFAVSGILFAASGSDPRTALMITLIPSLILGSILLPVWENALLLVAGLLTTAILRVPDMGPLLGTLVTTGILLGISVLFRNRIETERLGEVNRINQELIQAQASLEERVEERTAELAEASARAQKRADQLKAISDVGQQISQLQDIDSLLPIVTGLISEKLGYYHVGVFLLDSKKEVAVLRAANSDGGLKMLARGHQLKIGGVGIVSYAVTMNRPRIALDVAEDVYFAVNPSLPNTRSEMALPLAVGERIFGALDVQSTEPNAFSDEDIEVMRTLADQVALAIDNVNLLGETQRALADAQNLYREYFVTRWGEAGEEGLLGYRHNAAHIDRLQEPVRRPEVQAMLESGQSVVEAKGLATAAIPIKARDEVIGVLNIRANRPQRAFSDEDVTFMQAIAERVSLSLENARLFSAAQKRAAKERTIGNIAARIGESASIDGILKVAAEEIGRALPGSEVVVQIQQKEQPK